ncbi:MAG: DNA polymerase IV [Clostridia bacterium]|nr:DNA polymerase IV [Clostridia bacterium]
MDRVVLHSDLNNFYASVECIQHPEWRNIPMAVAGDPEARHGIVLAKNEVAKRYGIRTAEALWQARQKCPNILFVPPHFDRYMAYSRAAREMYSQYTDQVESFGADECWLDVTGSGLLFGSGEKIAHELRERMKKELGLTVSVGVSFNKVFAKLGSDMKKPDAVTILSRENFKEKVWPLPVGELLFAGPATCEKLRRRGITNIGQLAHAPVRFLEYTLGKLGPQLHKYANGEDDSPVLRPDQLPPVKSIGNSTTAAHDLTSPEDIRITLYVLCESVSARMREAGFNARTVQLTIKDNTLQKQECQCRLEPANHTAKALFDAAYKLYQTHKPTRPVRLLGVTATGFEDEEEAQLSFLPEAKTLERVEKLETAVDTLREKYGDKTLQRGLMFLDRSLSDVTPKKEHPMQRADNTR